MAALNWLLLHLSADYELLLLLLLCVHRARHRTTRRDVQRRLRCIRKVGKLLQMQLHLRLRIIDNGDGSGDRNGILNARVSQLRSLLAAIADAARPTAAAVNCRNNKADWHNDTKNNNDCNDPARSRL